MNTAPQSLTASSDIRNAGAVGKRHDHLGAAVRRRPFSGGSQISTWARSPLPRERRVLKHERRRFGILVLPQKSSEAFSRDERRQRFDRREVLRRHFIVANLDRKTFFERDTRARSCPPNRRPSSRGRVARWRRGNPRSALSPEGSRAPRVRSVRLLVSSLSVRRPQRKVR